MPGAGRKIALDGSEHQTDRPGSVRTIDNMLYGSVQAPADEELEDDHYNWG